MANKDLFKLFNPHSIAIIGASRSHKKLGYVVLRNIIDSGFKGRVYPVNPQANTIHHLTCYPDVYSLPEIPDLAILTIPAAGVNKTVQELGEKGVRNIVVFASGFKEIGVNGEVLQNELSQIAQDFSINLLGPNCLGFVNNLHDINATFSHVEKHIGNLRFISQSGAIASSIFDWAQSTHVGFSEFITLGNKATLSENDILSYWLHDKRELTTSKEFFLKDTRISKVSPIGMYLESIDDGEDFLNTISQLSLRHPIFLLKPGKSQIARKAMQSHTGAMTGEDAVLDAALRQAGVIRCEGTEDLFDLAQIFSWEDAPIGPNVAIISNAGGPAVISADFVEAEGLYLVEIEEKTKSRLKKYLPKEASLTNPIDVLGDALAARYASAIDIILGQSNVHALIIILTPQIMTEIYLTAEFITRLSAVHKKPIICAFMGGTNIEKGERVLHMHKIPTFRYPERAIRALGKLWAWKRQSLQRALALKQLVKRNEPLLSDIADLARINEIIEISRTSSESMLSNFVANEVLKSWGILTPPTACISSLTEAFGFVKKYNFPVVLKISAPGILHKKDSGGVITHITNRSDLATAYKHIKDVINVLPRHLRKHAAIQIQKEVSSGVEVIIGVKKDKNFGHVLMFGAGGTFAEITTDKNLHILPINHFSAEKLVENSKVFKVLQGYRGDKPYALKKLYFLLEKVSELVLTFPEFEEFEINPVIVTNDDIWAVDCKIVREL